MKNRFLPETDKWTDIQMDGLGWGWMDRQTNGRTDGCVLMDRQTDEQGWGWMDRQTKGRTDR